MAEASISVAQDQFICSICLDLLKKPVTIPCGHSYCMNCITKYWNYQSKVYSCPQCRQTFKPKPALNKNVVMAEMVEKLKTGLLNALRYAGPGDVECDVCSGRKSKAVISCLVCLESYCQTHFERHEEFHSGRHNVTDATGQLKQMICSKHNKQLEIFCRTDQCCICYLCTMDEHRNHDTVAAVVERTEKQKQLEETQRSFQQIIQEKEKKLQELKNPVKTPERSAQTAVKDSQRIAEPAYSTAVTVIRDQENTAESRDEGQLDVGQLEQAIGDLKWRDAELKQLSVTNDHICFLQCFQSLVSPLETSDGSIKNSSDVRKSISELKEQLYSLCKEEEKKISNSGEARPPLPLRTQHPLPPRLPSFQSPPSPPPPLRSQLPLPPTPPSIQSPPSPPSSPPPFQPPPPPPPALRSQQPLPPTSPSIQSPNPPLLPPRSQQPLPPPSVQSPPPLLPALRSQQPLPPTSPSIQSPNPPLPPPRSQQPLPPPSVQSPPPVLPALRSQQPFLPKTPSVQSPPPLSRSQPPLPPPSLPSHLPLPHPRSQQPLPPPLPSFQPPPSPPPSLPPSLQSPPPRLPPTPPALRSQPPIPPPKPLRLQMPPSPTLCSQTSPPPLPPPLYLQTSPPPLPPSFRPNH